MEVLDIRGVGGFDIKGRDYCYLLLQPPLLFFFWAQRVLQGHAGTFYFRSLKPAQLSRVPNANTVRALLLEATNAHAALLERLDLVTCGTRGTSKRDTSAYSCLRESGGVDPYRIPIYLHNGPYIHFASPPLAPVSRCCTQLRP